MKIEIHEYDGCFSFGMTAETVEDAAMLSRLKMNGKKEVHGIYVAALNNGVFTGSVVIGKCKMEREFIK